MLPLVSWPPEPEAGVGAPFDVVGETPLVVDDANDDEADEVPDADEEEDELVTCD